MAMFTGEVRTYLDVRNFVEAVYGPLDEASETQMLVFMGNALDQMWADVRKSSWFYDEWELTPVEGVFTLPAGVARICDIVGTTTTVGDDDSESSTEVTYELHLRGCGGSPCDGSVLQAVVNPVTGTITPDDEPNTLMVSGFRRPSHQFFTETTTGTPPAPCRLWADIDLPVPFRTAYAKAVAGFMFFGAGDHQRAGDWLNLANGEAANLRVAMPEIVDGTPEQRGIYRLGTKTFFAPTCGCNATGEWIYAA